MTRLPLLSATLSLFALLALAGCGDGQVGSGSVGLPDESPQSYQERSAHHPAPPPTDPEEPIVGTELPLPNVYGLGGPGAAVTPAPAPPPAVVCQLAADACDGCTTAVDCCDCYGGDATVCAAACTGLP